MQYFAVLTLALPTSHGMTQMTFARTLAVDPGSTRSGIYERMRQEAASRHGSQWDRANTLFFSAEPDVLG